MGNDRSNQSIPVSHQGRSPVGVPVREVSRGEKEMTIVISTTGPRFAIGKVGNDGNRETCHLSCDEEMSALARADIWPYLIRPGDKLRVRAIPSTSGQTDWHAVEVVAWCPSCPPTVEGEMCLGTYHPYEPIYKEGEDGKNNGPIHVIELDEEDEELRAGITSKAVQKLRLNFNTPVVCWVVNNNNPDLAGDLLYFANWVRKVAEAGEEPPAVLDLNLAGNGLRQV